MAQIDTNKNYNSIQITESDGKWTNFEGYQGSQIETFLKDKLEDSVVDFKFQASGYELPNGQIKDHILIGKNAFGKDVCYTQIINANPTYTVDFEFKTLKINNTTYSNSNNSLVQINKSDTLTAQVLFKYIVTGNLAGNNFNETSAQSITFKWFKDSSGDVVDNTLDTLTKIITPGEEVSVDITKLFDNPFSNKYLGIVYKSPGGIEETTIFKQPFTLRKLELSYTGESIINNTTLSGIKLSGTENENLNSYSIEYYLDNTTKATKQLSSSTQAENITLTFDRLTEGTHNLFMRIVSTNLTSNYIQISFIYQKSEGSNLSEALAIISEVPDEINNCDLSKFFKVTTTNKLSGNINIVALKSNNIGNITTIKSIEDAKKSKYLFKEINLDLINTDESQKMDYFGYIEVSGESSEYLKILISNGKTTEELKYYAVNSQGTVTQLTYKTISIVDPKEGSSHLQYTKGEILNFSQISNGNVFTELSNNLDDSDGFQLESQLTTFKVSPTSGVFTNPKSLLSSGNIALHKNAFSIEMMIKTYGVSDLNDKILTIGNITLCPNYLFINYDSHLNTEPYHIVNASRADFRKEAIQHITITYDPNYKPSTYDLIYDKFFSLDNNSYTKNAQAYPCLKIYVNGTINRVISVESSTICSENNFNFQIHPTNSNINFYIFRTYDKTLNYEEVKKNYISSKSNLQDKQNYYSDNDILYLKEDFPASSDKSQILNTISLGKCINTFTSVSYPNKIYKDRKVLLLVLPEGTLPPYYGNRKNDSSKATFLIHYPKLITKSTPSEYSGRLSGGKVKAQGSSAKKYMLPHNTSYSKFTFTPEIEFNKENPTTYDYYKMPGSDIEVKKVVGKVNVASSMQSHKQGATKLFHEAYMQSGIDTSWMNGGRKAVLEDEFLYFFVNVPESELDSITWDYFKQEDGTYNFENCYFLGFQTWGSAKGDELTSGYSDATPHYLMLEGADNDNSSTNFKTPWASMQIWGNYEGNNIWGNANSTIIDSPTTSPSVGKNYYHQFSGGTKNSETGFYTPDYETGLLIKDETIVFNPGTESGTSSDKKADAWDVNFGITKGEGYSEEGVENLFYVFKDTVKSNLKRFAEFYNLIYTFDFSSLLYIESGSTIDGFSMEINNKPSYQYKLIFGADCTINYGGKSVTPKAGDIYRWEKAWPTNIMSNSQAKWVPGGLYHNGTDWETLNIIDICNQYVSASSGQLSNYPSEYDFFKKEEYNELRAVTTGAGYKYISGYYDFTGYDDLENLKTMQACMAEAFKIICHEYLDNDDVSYHQAFIKLLNGTDNRAKNTYFQIVGLIYTNKAVLSDNTEVDIVKIEEGEYKDICGYIKNNQFYKVDVNGEQISETGDIYNIDGIKTKPYYYKQSGKGDNKIRLYQDDLDTILKTDNNGQQIKPYYLLEPPYNTDLEYLWGDLHSGFFYNYDLTFIDEIKNKLSNLLEFSTGSDWPDSENTKFNEYFFSIQKNLPAIAYNHQSEIYYESTQTLWQNGEGTNFYNLFKSNDSWKDFNNNKVYNPVSLSHGSCLESEIEYLRDRVLLLSTYTNSAKNKTDIGIKLNGGSSETQGSEIEISTKYTSFIQYIYPIVNDIQSSKNSTKLQYDPLLDYMSWNGSDYNNIDLIYNIASPNESTELSVRFVSSSLTSDSYWTNTDLYKTVWINSGTESFISLFSFPNANTVISQDSNYNIVIDQHKEIEVVNYLKNIEHLILQNATINSDGLNFIGCNQLKTLVLGTTEDLLTDSNDETAPDEKEYYSIKFTDVLNESEFIKINGSTGSTGFNQIILPKSNTLEQVILPNCIKIANINYYPNLTRFEFNSGTQLTNLTIDGRNNNKIIQNILNNFIGSWTTNLEITNIPENFWLTEELCRKLTQINNVKILGTINIGNGTTLKDIDWSTKRMLVEKFGDIFNGTLKFNYQQTDVTPNTIQVNLTGTIESSGPAPIILKISGNKIPITGNNLKITYSITDEYGNIPNSNNIRFENQYKPNLIIGDGVTGTYIITTKIYYNSNNYISKQTSITVGFYTPKPGDFAYANGTFSSIFDPDLGLIGIVFYSKRDNNIQDVRILSANQSSTNLPMAPADYANDFSSSSNKKLQQEKYNSLLGKLVDDIDSFISDVYNNRSSIASGQIKYDLNLHNESFKITDEHDQQKDYIARANSYVAKLSNNGIISEQYIEQDHNIITLDGKNRFEYILNQLKNKNQISIGTSSYSNNECDGFLYALYPAFLKALYYVPNNLSGKGENYFGLGKWYIPNSEELERIIYYRIMSSINNESGSENLWNATNASDLDVSDSNLNIFTKDAFNNIMFLKDTSSQITSEGNEDGEGLTYGIDYYYNSSPGWMEQCPEYYYQQCARDENHNISPVCRIEIPLS